MRFFGSLLFIAAVGLCWTPVLHAAVTFSGTGESEDEGVFASASAVFTINGNTLTVVLTNTSSDSTPANGQVITGVIWDFNPNLAGALTYVAASNPTLTVGSNIFVDGGGSGANQIVKIDNTTALGGSYSNDLTNTSLGDFGVSTTGGNGIFGAGAITLGNGGPNYGLVAAGTFTDGGSAHNKPNSLPFVQTSVTFTFTFTGTLTEAQIVGAKFLVGTGGDYFAATERDPVNAPLIPEPASLAIWSLGVVAAAFGARRMRKRK